MSGSRSAKARQADHPAPPRTVRWRLVVLLLLAGVAVIANAAWWLARPQLAPLPSIPMEQLEPRVAGIVAAALAGVEQDGRSPMAWGDLGAVLRAHDLGPQANVCFRNAELLDDDDYRWPYYLGVSLSVTDLESAVECYRRAAQRAGDRPHVHLRLAEALLDRGMPAEAEPVIERVLASHPTDARAQLAKARCLFSQEKLQESRTWAEKSAAAAPDMRATHLLLAQLCRRLNDAEGQDRALAALASIPEGITPWDDPDVAALFGLRQDRSARLRSAKELARSGLTASATDVLSELAQESDPTASAALALADALVHERKYAQAEKLLRQYVQDQPDDERIRFLLGVACFQQGNYPQAAEEFRRTIELKPDNVMAHYNLGHALQKCGDAQGAKEAFLAAVRLRPGHGLARANLAELWLAEGNREEARRHLRIAARLIPNDPAVRDLIRQLGPVSP